MNTDLNVVDDDVGVEVNIDVVANKYAAGGTLRVAVGGEHLLVIATGDRRQCLGCSVRGGHCNGIALFP